MKDFTIEAYRMLLETLQCAGYQFITVAESAAGMPKEKTIILRHDVDLLPCNSLRTAQLEYELGIRGTYYFRAVPESWDENVIRQIAALGHEIGYHYESLTTTDGDVPRAYEDFCRNLERLRAIVPVTTICMHGSPRSEYDSKDIWIRYNYIDLGIVAEPYLDTDFSKWFYLTDTGRMWDGYRVSVRDKIEGYQEQWEAQGLRFHRTQDVIAAIAAGRLPSHVMFTVHPQRWNPFGWQWLKECVLQNVKNVVKRMVIWGR